MTKGGVKLKMPNEKTGKIKIMILKFCYYCIKWPAMGKSKESWDSQNNSAFFSRISAISGTGNPHVEKSPTENQGEENVCLLW